MEIYTIQRPSLSLAAACAPSATWLHSTASAVIAAPQSAQASRVDQVQIQAGRAFGTDVLDITPGDVPMFKGGSSLGNFFTGTRIEAGKYINGRTFVGLQEQGGQPGASIEHRTADGWRFNASIAPRIILREPTLTQQPYRTTRSFGGFIIREWRF